MSYNEKIRIIFVFVVSTLLLLIGILSTIVISGLYFSPVSDDFSEDTIITYKNLIRDDLPILRKVLSDDKIDNDEKNNLNKLNFYKYNFGKIKIISNTYRLTHQYSIGNIDDNNLQDDNFIKSIGNITVNIVIFIKDKILIKNYNDCVNFSFIPFADENIGPQYSCANKNISTVRLYSSNYNDSGFIISTVLPINDSKDKNLGFVQILTKAHAYEVKLGKFLISVLSPLMVCMLLIGLFVLYLQKFLSKKIEVNFLNANNIAHNLKNKTNAIRFYLQKNIETTNDAKIYFLKIKNILDNLDKFIDTTLKAAKQNHNNNKNFNMNSKTSILTITNVIKDLYVSENIIFEGKNNYDVIADKYRLIDALTAIIDNSLYWNKQNKPVIINIKKKFSFVEISILDYGPGLTEKEKKYIFNEGYSKSEGNGIGLYIAKKIINSFGGKLQAINRDNEGLCMLVKLRLFKDV